MKNALFAENEFDVCNTGTGCGRVSTRAQLGAQEVHVNTYRLVDLVDCLDGHMPRIHDICIPIRVCRWVFWNMGYIFKAHRTDSEVAISQLRERQTQFIL